MLHVFTGARLPGGGWDKPASAILSLSMTSWCGRVMQIHVEQQGGAAICSYLDRYFCIFSGKTRLARRQEWVL